VTELRHILSADQFTPELAGQIFARASVIDRQLSDHPEQLTGGMENHILYRLFYEPSTRTYESFGFAAARLGMRVLGTQTVEFSSVSKGETLPDTIRTICQYLPSIIVLRSRMAGEAALAAQYSTAPIINAGDGKGEHPTQALLDLYSIQQELGRTSGLRVVVGGDLAHGRTVRSLVKLLLRYPGNAFTFVSPPELVIPADLRNELSRAGAVWEETDSEGLHDALRSADAVYWTRTQKERLSDDLKALHQDAGAYRIGLKEAAMMPKHARIFHPLPRVDEIGSEVDNDPRAAYFRQMHYGLVVRMALMEWVLGKDIQSQEGL
jgi:aspartate carbamoyltransferase